MRTNFEAFQQVGSGLNKTIHFFYLLDIQITIKQIKIEEIVYLILV